LLVTGSSLVAGCSSAWWSSEVVELTTNSTRSCRVILCREFTRIQVGSLEPTRPHCALKTERLLVSGDPFARTHTTIITYVRDWMHFEGPFVLALGS